MLPRASLQTTLCLSSTSHCFWINHSPRESADEDESGLKFSDGDDVDSAADADEVRRERVRQEKERKALAKEIYGKVLSGDFNSLTLQQINDYINESTPDNPYGRRISERLPQRVVRKIEREKGIAAVDALFSRISESSVRPHERTRPSGRRTVEERKKELLEQWAKASGNWHTDLMEFTDDPEPIGSGTDSDVYLSKDGLHVIKMSKGKPYGKRFRPDIDNIPLLC